MDKPQPHAVRAYGDLEALALTEPQVLTPLGFMIQASERPPGRLLAAIALTRDPAWLSQLAANSGMLE